MPKTTEPPHTSEEVAQQVGDNTTSILKDQGHNLTWLADEIGISVDRLLSAFSSRVDTWLLFDIAFYLNVAPDSLIEAR